MFSKNYEFRYGDLGRDRVIRVSTVLDLLQDVATDHASHAGLDAKLLQSKSIAFLLDGWRVKFKKPLNPYSPATATTGIMRARKCETLRKYEIWQGGECKVIATSIWFAVNTEKRSIARISEDFYAGFDNISEDDNGLEYINLRPIKETEYRDSYRVAKRDIDTNNHMNNVKSVELLLDYIPDGYEYSELVVKYRKELMANEEITVYSKETEDGCYVEIRNSEDKPCVLIKAIA